MEKKTSHSENLVPVLIYLDDIEKIFGYLKEVSEIVKIETDEYTYDDFEELQNNENENEVLYDLKIKMGAPYYISLDLRSHEARLYRGDDSSEAVGVFTKIKELLHKRRRIATGRLGLYFTLALLGVGAFFGLDLIQRGKESLVHLIGGTTTLVLVVATYILSYHTNVNQYSVIYLKKKKDLPSFCSRNKDEIILVVISVLSTALVTALITLAVVKLW